MLETLALFVLALGVFMLASRIFGKRGKKLGRDGSSPLDAWVESEAARLTAEKLLLDEKTVLKTISGDPDPETVTSLERAVRKIEVLYERIPGALGGHAADVTLEISYEDGSKASARRRAPFAELAQSVRDEFARTGGARVYRPFVFAWQR